jgi:uncharacterized protein (TIGR02996 family)
MAATPPEELFAAIRAEPDADGPRLAYADRLEQAGQAERAEYVRLSVRQERMPTSLVPGYQAARRRMSDLHRTHQKAWLAERPALDGVRWVMHRGLPEHVWFDSYTAFHRHHETVFEYFVTRVGLSNLRAPRKFFESPGLTPVRELDLRTCGGFDATGVTLLAASPHLANLTWLAIPGSVCRPAELMALANSPHLSNLRTLILGGYYGQAHGTPDGFLALANSPHLTRLTRLDLGRMRPGPQGAEALFTSRNFANLTWLNLDEGGLGPAGLEALEDGSRLAALEYLSLGSNSLGDEGTRLVAIARRLTRLRTLFLGRNLIGNEGARHLAGARHLRGLVSLGLSGNAVGGAGLKALIESKNFPALEGLDLGGNLFGDDAMLALGQTKHFPKLRLLEAHGVPAHRELVTRVQERFREGRGPIEGLPQAAPPPAVPRAAPVGHADEDGLLEAIIAAPEDELPRLVYADWLEDHGETDRAALLRQGEEADAALVARATPAIPKEFAGIVHRVQFERGLLTVRVQMRGLLTKAFQAGGPDWLRAVRVFRLVIYGMTRDWAKVAAMPLLSQVRMLQVDHGSLKREGLPALLGSRHLGRLFGLDLTGNQMGYSGRLKALTEATLPNLCNLALADNYLNVDRIRELAAWRPARKLTALNLTHNWVYAGGVALLANSDFSSELTQLTLTSAHLADQAIHALIESPSLNRLTHLWLSHNAITDAGIQALAASPFLRRLQRLDLSYNRFSGEAALTLARSPNFAPACKLRLWQHSFVPGVMAQLREVLGPRLVT